MDYPKITLKAARVNANLTQKDAAFALGITAATLQNYETGKTIPDWDLVKKIEAIYGFPADFILFARNSA